MSVQVNALCSVADITARGISKATPIIEDAINSISDEFEGFCGRIFRSQQHVEAPTGDQAPLEWLCGSGGRLLQVFSYPISAISEIKVYGQTVTDFVWDLPGYKEQGLIYRAAGWPRACGYHDDLTMDPDPTHAMLSISVAYTGGFSTIPADLKLAAISEVMARVSLPPGRHLAREKTVGGWDRTMSPGSGGGDWSNKTRELLSSAKYMAPRRDRP